MPGYFMIDKHKKMISNTSYQMRYMFAGRFRDRKMFIDHKIYIFHGR